MTKFFLISFYLMAFLISCSRSPEVVQEELVERFIRNSGVDKQLALISESVSSEMDSQKNLFPPDKFVELKSIFDNIYSIKIIRSQIKSSLIKKANQASLKMTNQWLQGTFGKKIVSLETNSQTKSERDLKETFRKKIMEVPPSDYRMDLVKKIDRYTFASRLSFEETQISRKMLYLAQLKNQGANEQDINSIIREDGPKIHYETYLETLSSLLQTYRSISDVELKEYSDFLKLPHSKELHKIILDAYLKALEKTTKEATVKLTEFYKSMSVEKDKTSKD